MSSASTPLQAALAADLSSADQLRQRLERLGDYPIAEQDDAAAVCSRLADLLVRDDWPTLARGTASPVCLLMGLFQDPSTPGAFHVFQRVGMPLLVAVWDAKWPEQPADRDVLLLQLKIFAMYNDRAAHERLVQAAQAGFAAEDPMWSIIFRQIDQHHPGRHYLVSQLREPLPAGLIGAGYLNLCNLLALAGELIQHPFDSLEGTDRLRDWLQETAPDRVGLAQVAATGLPFVTGRAQDELLEIGLKHTSPAVELEAAWAAGRLGRREGYEHLQRWCLDQLWSPRACSYLQELGQQHRIPAEARTADFQAASEMTGWLAHPMEYGRPPDALELVDRRELNWPPTKDRRTLWLFRFRYDQPAEEHFGLVGSTTFSLRTPTTLPPADLYALHCAWELQVHADPRASAELTAEAGHKLLELANSDWGKSGRQ